jgi:hypothetical protein
MLFLVLAIVCLTASVLGGLAIVQSENGTTSSGVAVIVGGIAGFLTMLFWWTVCRALAELLDPQ